MKPETIQSPWSIGLRAAKANFAPGLLLQGFMVALVSAYYFHPPTQKLLLNLASVKEQWGVTFSFLSAVAAGAFLPELLIILFFQKGRIRWANFRNLEFTIFYWGFIGVFIDFFYRLQAFWFGTEVNFHTVLFKVLVDQFIYNPLIAAPFSILCFTWKDHGYSSKGLSGFFTVSFYRRKMVPVLVATWGVWIPITAMIYSLPPLLQIPLFALALSFWVLIFTYITSLHRPEPLSGDPKQTETIL